MMTTSAVEQPKCQYCGAMQHQGTCPTVKAIEYHPDGTVKRVEFKTQTDFHAFPPIDYNNPKLTAAAQVDFSTMKVGTTWPPRS